MSSWDYELARALRELPASGVREPVVLEGTVVQTAPLTVSLCGGEVMAPPMLLECVPLAQGLYRDRTNGHLYLEAWKPGDRAVCCLMGGTVVILGKLAGTGWQIPVR